MGRQQFTDDFNVSDVNGYSCYSDDETEFYKGVTLTKQYQILILKATENRRVKLKFLHGVHFSVKTEYCSFIGPTSLEDAKKHIDSFEVVHELQLR